MTRPVMLDGRGASSDSGLEMRGGSDRGDRGDGDQVRSPSLSTDRKAARISPAEA